MLHIGGGREAVRGWVGLRLPKKMQAAELFVQ